MKSYKIMASIANYVTGHYEVVKEVVQDDDSVDYILHTFRMETPENYAALYDLTSIDEAIDMVLHEPFVGSVDTLKKSAAEAREAFRGKMSEVKSKNVKLEAKDKNGSKARMATRGIEEKYLSAVDIEDPVQLIRDTAPFHSEVIRLRKEHYQRLRTKPNRPVEDRLDDRARIAEAKRTLQGLHRASERAPVAEAMRSVPQVQKHVKLTLRKGHKPELS